MPAPRSAVVAIQPASLTSIGGCVVSHATRHGQPNKLASAAAKAPPASRRREGTMNADISKMVRHWKPRAGASAPMAA